MNVLSLFDGISCGQIALNRAGIRYDNYYASEIDKNAIKVTRHNYPDTIQLGDIRKVCCIDLPDIDLLIGGSPCQGFSFAGKQLNFEDPRSKLFFEYVRLLKELEPKYFLLENVKMKKEYQDVISGYMGCEPVTINSALVSAQNRKRLYWTNIFFDLPGDKGLILKDVLIEGLPFKEKSQTILSTLYKENAKSMVQRNKSGLLCLNAKHSQGERIYDVNGLSPTLSGNALRDLKVYLNDVQLEYAKKQHAGKTWKSGNRMGNMIFPQETNRKSKTVCSTTIPGARATNHISDIYGIRKLTPVECERLQTIPDNYTNMISDTQRYRAIGNGWTVDIIAHIFKGLK